MKTEIKETSRRKNIQYVTHLWEGHDGDIGKSNSEKEFSSINEVVTMSLGCVGSLLSKITFFDTTLV